MKKRKDGRYVKKVTLPDKTVKYLYSDAKNEREAAKDFNAQLLSLEKKKKASKQFKNVAEEWSDTHFKTLQNNSLKLYNVGLRKAVEYFGETQIEDITPSDVNNYVDFLVAQKYAKKTIKERVAVLKQIFNFAIIRQYIYSSPCRFVKLPTNLVSVKREAATKNEEDVIRSVNADVPFGFFAKFLLYTGCRRGEALALTSADIDYDNQVVSINKTVEWIGNVPQIKNSPKTDAGNRQIPLPDILMEELKKRKKQKYIFENDEHGLMHNAQVTRKWAALKRATGITCTPHQLRHSYQTMLFDAGIDVKTAQKWLGHSDIKTTLGIYTHLSESRLEQSTEKWKNFIDNLK